METDDKKSPHQFTDPSEAPIIIIGSIFFLGALIYYILSFMLPLSPVILALIDAALLTVVLSPIIYYLAVKPCQSYIEELERYDQTLQMSEARYRSLVETTDDSIYLVNRNCEYVFMNTKHRARLGFLGREYEGRAYGDFHTPEETSIFSEKVNRVFATGNPLQHKHRSKRDGSYFLRTLSPVRGPNNSIAAVSVVSKNISILE